MPDRYYDRADRWKAELCELRTILLDLGLEEALKWRQPCYLDRGRNIALVGAFKDAAVLSFFEGALLDDPAGLLQVPGENTRSARTLRFTSVAQIHAQEPVIRSYLQQAIDNERAGKSVDPSASPATPIPAELTQAFDEDRALETAFAALTPGRQRGYLLHFAAAKQSATRRNRILKYKSRILDGKGINDCVCGRSKHMPRCDGSHRENG